jgi:hypothetical protein
VANGSSIRQRFAQNAGSPCGGRMAQNKASPLPTLLVGIPIEWEKKIVSSTRTISGSIAQSRGLPRFTNSLRPGPGTFGTRHLNGPKRSFTSRSWPLSLLAPFPQLYPCQ